MNMTYRNIQYKKRNKKIQKLKKIKKVLSPTAAIPTTNDLSDGYK